MIQDKNMIEEKSILTEYMSHTLVLKANITHLTIRMFILLHWQQNQNILI